MSLIVPCVNHQLPNDLSPTDRDRLDSFDFFADRRTGRQVRLYQFRLRQNAPQQIIEVMRDAACQHSQTFQLLSGKGLLLRTPGIGDVLTGAKHPHW